MYVQSNVINTCWLKMKFSALTETDLGMQFAAEDVASVWWSLSHKAQTVAAALRSRSHLLNFFLVWFSSSFVMRRGRVTQHAEARNLTCRLSAWWFQGESSSNICSHSLLLCPVYMKLSTFTQIILKISATWRMRITVIFDALMRRCHQRLQEIDVTVTCPNSRPRVVRWSSGQVSS